MTTSQENGPYQNHPMLISDFTAFRNVRNKCLLFKPPSLWYFVIAAQSVIAAKTLRMAELVLFALMLFQFSLVTQLCPTLCDPMTTACQASLSITISWSLYKLMSTELVVSSNHFILCCPLLLLPSIAPSIRVFSNESVLHIRWPSYWSFSFSISPSNEY